MTLYSRRERFSGLSERIGRAASRLGLSPNHWTLMGLLCAAVSAWFLSMSEFVFAAVFVAATAVMDIVDGAVARYTARVSVKGAYADTIADRYAEFIIVAGILLAGLPDFMLPASLWLFLYLFGSMMTTYAKASAKEKGVVNRELRGGVLERAERMVVLLIGIILASYSPEYLTYVVAGLAVLANISALQRIFIATRNGKF